MAELPGAQRVIPQVPLASAIILALGASILCLSTRQAKYAGCALLFSGLVMAQFNTFPDILIERTAANTAFRNDSGELVFATPTRAALPPKNGCKPMARKSPFKEAATRAGWTCEARSCRSEIKGKVVGYFMDGEGAVSLLCWT